MRYPWSSRTFQWLPRRETASLVAAKVSVSCQHRDMPRLSTDSKTRSSFAADRGSGPIETPPRVDSRQIATRCSEVSTPVSALTTSLCDTADIARARTLDCAELSSIGKAIYTQTADRADTQELADSLPVRQRLSRRYRSGLLDETKSGDQRVSAQSVVLGIALRCEVAANSELV